MLVTFGIGNRLFLMMYIISVWFGLKMKNKPLVKTTKLAVLLMPDATYELSYKRTKKTWLYEERITMSDKCKYYEWDEDNFILPAALNVFWSVGGLDFFNVTEPDYYAVDWLEFVGMLYSRIEDEEFFWSGKKYIVPLTIEQKEELVSRGVLPIFVTDLN